MRGSTVKKLSKFADVLIANSTEQERKDKPKHQVVNELKVHWKTKGKTGRKFIDDVLSGKIK